ncbi:MAG: DEAD/DEAH box helicase [Spirochaetales bacterium]|nr:DEAD/DEAH box helicase [Spirochaetales bacterium]
MNISEFKPLIVQGDSSLLLDVHNPDFESARGDITPFSELEKSPEHMHTYKITPLSLWNAASAGITHQEISDILDNYSRFPVPDNVKFTIKDIIGRYGKLYLDKTQDDMTLQLIVDSDMIYAELSAQKSLKNLLRPMGELIFQLNLLDRGVVKQELLKLGYPVKDLAPLKDGDPYNFKFRDVTLSGRTFGIRDYQKEACEAFVGNNKPGTGFGTLVLPCGAGKTIVGMNVMEKLQTNTLILTTNVAAVHQWIDELADKTDIPREEIGEYTGDRKVVKPITVATYQILVWRKDKESEFPHFDLFRTGNWGLIIYDEVHLLPAPVFKVTAEIQAVRRVGLTATLIREDGAEGDVFTLVGPKRYDVPWKQLENKGWIATAYCHEIRVDIYEDDKLKYAIADKRKKFRIASENPWKVSIIKKLLNMHKDDQVLVIGQYVDQLQEIAKIIKAPLITGKTPNPEREVIFDNFKKGIEKVIVVSKVANFAINLPDASVAIQVSGTFGSRQEEAQRLGRILRPKEKDSFFYSIVTRHTTEETFAANRQKFLTEQGYKYNIEIWNTKDLM